MHPSRLRKSSFVPIALFMGCSVVVLILAVSLPSHAQDAGPVVATTGGQVQGRLLPSAGAVFKGIPYAAPPVGELRWREPHPVRAWKGLRQAAEYGADCPAVPGGIEYSAAFGVTLNQGGAVSSATPPTADRGTRHTSEDCLFLNVWTPQWPSSGKQAVMVWLHGGELAGGSGALRSGPADQAESSLARNGVVVVSINYRGHLLGMMGHPELTAESPHRASGNYVLLDQIAALQWVHDNIAAFGGDPGNVTIFGQSGGGRSVSMLIASPLTKGLVHRAIIESGSPMEATRPYLTEAELEKIGLALGESLNAPKTGAIAYLRSLPAADIAAALQDVRRRLDEQDLIAFDEGIDGYVTPEAPSTVFKAHKELHIPLIVGNTAHDSGTVIGGMPWHTGAAPYEARAWTKALLQLFYSKYPDLLDKALKAYGLSGAAAEPRVSYPPYGTLPQQVGTDINHRCGVATTALWHSAVAPTYQFEFSRATPQHPALHTAELPFLFGYLSNEDLKDPSAAKVRDQVQAYWTNFAKTGDPNGPGLPVWRKYDATKPSIEFINDGAVPRTAVRAVACAPYIEKFAREPAPLVGGANARLRGGNVK